MIQPQEQPLQIVEMSAPGALPPGMLPAMARFRNSARYAKHYKHFYKDALDRGLRASLAQYEAFCNASPLYYTHQPSAEKGFQNALIADEDWRMLTDEVQFIARQRRSISDALISRGLVAPIDSIGRFSYEWQKFGDTSAANVKLHMRADVNQDQGEFSLDGTPIPVIYKDYHLDERELEASRASNVAPIDLAHIAEGAEKVSDAIETIMVQGDAGIVFRGRTLLGVTNSGNILTQAASGDWATSTLAASSVRLAISLARVNNHRGPFVLFVPTIQYSELETPWSTTSSEPVREVILRQHANLESIVEAPALPAGNPVLIEMSRRNIEMPIAQDIIPIQYDNPLNGGVTIRVMAVLSVAIKADAAGQSGIVEITGA